MKLFVTLVSFTLLLTQSVASAQPAASQHEQLQNYAHKVVHQFIKSTVSADVLERAELPSVAVQLSGGIIYFDDKENKVVVPPSYEHLPPQLQTEIRSIAPADDAETTAAFFDLLFNQFLIAHEAAHWVQHIRGTTEQMDRYQAEADANKMAANYWLQTPNGREMLLTLRTQLQQGQQRMSNPVPDGAEPQRYFHENYAKLARSANDYGYFQYQFILTAIDSVL